MKKLKINKLSSLFSNKFFLFLLLILFSVFWIFWIPGPRVANDFSFVSKDWLKLQFDIPRVWNERGAEGLGEYGVFTLWSYPINLFFGIFANFGLTFEIWERLLIILFIFLGSISIWKLLKSYGLSDKAKFIGALFYLVNTYSILLIDGGQISIACAYGLFPLAFLLTLKAVYAGTAEKILAGLAVTALGFFDIRFIYIIFLLLLLKALFDVFSYGKNQAISTFKNWIGTGVIIGLLLIGINSFWLIAQIRIPLDKNVFDSFTRISTDFVNIGHAFLIISPHWYKNVFGQISQLKFEFILLPILAFTAPILKRKDKVVMFWMAVAVISIFLTKGSSKPLPNVYPWLHLNIPGFSFFRDSTKFFFLVTLSYSMLIAISTEEIIKRISDKKVATFFLLSLAGYLIFLIRPVFLNQMTGTLSIQPFEKEFQSLTSVLQEDKNFGRVLWIPATAPLTYSDLNHPIVEAARVFNRIPFVWGVKGSYETFNFLREAPYTGEIFDVAGISYIAYPRLNFERETNFSDNTKYYYTFLHQLSNLPWIEKIIPDSKVPLLQTKTHQDKIFITDNTWVVFGTEDIFNKIDKEIKLKLSNNAVIFAEYENGLGPLISQYPEAKIVLNKKTKLDLLATFFPKSTMIFPARQLSVKPNEAGWWKSNGTDLIAWRDFLQSKYSIDSKEFDYGGGWAVGEGNLTLRINNSGFNKDKRLFARVMESSGSGNLKFYQDGQEIGRITTIIDGDTSIRWFDAGKIINNDELTIISDGKINVINALALIDGQSLNIYQKEAENFNKQITEFKTNGVVSNNSSVTYKKISQTKYQIKVSNLTNPEIVVFSETFHPLWKVNNKSSVPVYGFLNGFRIDKDGYYLVEFKPQDGVTDGLVISVATLIIVTGFFLFRVIKGSS